MERDCANCDYSPNSLGGRCCWDDEPEPVMINKNEKLYSEDDLHSAVLMAVSKSEDKCNKLKQELLNLTHENNQLLQQSNKCDT